VVATVGEVNRSLVNLTEERLHHYIMVVVIADTVATRHHAMSTGDIICHVVSSSAGRLRSNLGGWRQFTSSVMTMPNDTVYSCIAKKLGREGEKRDLRFASLYVFCVIGGPCRYHQRC